MDACRMNRHHHHQPMRDDDRGDGNRDRDERRARATAYLTSWIEQNSFMIDIPEHDTDVDGGVGDCLSSVSLSEDGFGASVGSMSISDNDADDDDLDNASGDLYQQQQQERQQWHQLRQQQAKSFDTPSRFLYQQQERDRQAKSFHEPDSGVYEPRGHAISAPGAGASDAGKETYLHHLDLGDVGSPKDMLRNPPSNSTNGETHLRAEIESLKVHDFAFILRSDGRWTYAIIAEREKDTIRFVVDTDGGTKSFLKRNWPSSIQLVNPEACRRSWRKKGGSNKELKNKKEEKDQRICTATKNKCKKQRSI